MVVLRWLLVLPAAVVAFLVANLLLIFWNMLSPSFATMSPRWVQFISSIIGAYMFVVVGTLVAPTKKNIVAIILTVLLAMLCAAITTLAIVKGPGSDPLWLLVVCLIASIVAAIVACAKIVLGGEDSPLVLRTNETEQAATADRGPLGRSG